MKVFLSVMPCLERETTYLLEASMHSMRSSSHHHNIVVSIASELVRCWAAGGLLADCDRHHLRQSDDVLLLLLTYTLERKRAW